MFETHGYQVLQTRTHEINVKRTPATGTTWYPYPLPVGATNVRAQNYRPSTLMTKIFRSNGVVVEHVMAKRHRIMFCQNNGVANRVAHRQGRIQDPIMPRADLLETIYFSIRFDIKIIDINGDIWITPWTMDLVDRGLYPPLHTGK